MQSNIEAQAVRTALDAMRQATLLDSSHPLRQFNSIQQFYEPTIYMTGEAVTDVAIFDYLTHLITKRLNWHRRICQLTPMSREQGFTPMLEDFRASNSELEAW